MGVKSVNKITKEELRKELADLEIKIATLTTQIKSEEYSFLPKIETEYMEIQLNSMYNYASALQNRINIIEKKEKERAKLNPFRIPEIN